MNYNYEIVKTGTWNDRFNEKDNEYEVEIIKSFVRYGSGDDRDHLYVKNDFPVECYYIIFVSESTIKEEKMISSRSEESYISLEEAMEQVEKMTNKGVKWNEESKEHQELKRS